MRLVICTTRNAIISPAFDLFDSAQTMGVKGLPNRIWLAAFFSSNIVLKRASRFAISARHAARVPPPRAGSRPDRSRAGCSISLHPRVGACMARSARLRSRHCDVFDQGILIRERGAWRENISLHLHRMRHGEDFFRTPVGRLGLAQPPTVFMRSGPPPHQRCPSRRGPPAQNPWPGPRKCRGGAVSSC